MPKGLGDIAGLLKQAQKMQTEMQKLKENLKDRKVEGSAGGGMVQAVANGDQELVSVKIDPEAVNRDDVEMLEDLVVAAANQALQKSRELLQQEVSNITGGLDIGGLLG